MMLGLSLHDLGFFRANKLRLPAVILNCDLAEELAFLQGRKQLR